MNNNEIAEGRDLDLRARMYAHLVASRLSGFDPFRRCADRVLDGDRLSGGDVDTLIVALTRLGDSQWRERVVAIWTLGAADLDEPRRADADRAVSGVVRDNVKDTVVRIGVRFGRYVWRTALMVSIAVMSLTALRSGAFLVSDIGAIGTLVCILVAITALIATPFVSPVLDAKRNDLAREMGAWYLGKHGGADRHLLALASVVTLRRASSAPRTVESLIRLIRRSKLTADDLDQRVARIVTRGLCDARLIEEYAVAEIAVPALRDVGDETAIRPLQRLAASYGPNTQAKRPIEEAIAAIEARKRGAAEPHELLRAAHSEPTSETLLRPLAGAPAELPNEQLLRPTSTDA